MLKRLNDTVLEENQKQQQQQETGQVSISPTFYKWLFCLKVFTAAFLSLQFGLVIFKRKEISAKAARKLLVKLTTG